MSKHMYCSDNTMWAGRTLTVTDERVYVGHPQVHAVFDTTPDANPVREHWLTKSDCIPIPEIGQTVTVPTINGIPGYDGATCVVSKIEYDANAKKPLITGEFTSVQKPDDTLALAFYEWSSSIPVAPQTDEVTIAELKAKVEELTQQNTRLIGDLDQQRAFVRDYRDDCQAWNTAIKDEAEDRSWCYDYERFLDDRVRPNLKRWVIEEREQEWEVEVSISGTISTSYTVNVTARSQDDANEMVKDDPDSFFEPGDVLADRARYDGFDDIEVEVED